MKPNDGVSHCITERLILLLKNGNVIELKKWYNKGGWNYWITKDNQLANNSTHSIIDGGGIIAKFHIKYKYTGHHFYNNFKGSYTQRT